MVNAEVQYQGPGYAAQRRAARAASVRELDSRTGDGVEVCLLWHPQDDRLWVSVNDTRTGESFKVRVRDGERALDVFHHPYAYAALATPSPF